MKTETNTNCTECGYIGSELGCENPACNSAHWHTAATRAAKAKVEAEQAAFRATWNTIDYSLSLKGAR